MNEVTGSKFLLNNSLCDTTNFPAQFENSSTIIYEVVRLINGKIVFLDDHLERFFSSCQLVQKKSVLSGIYLTEALKMLIKGNGIMHGNIKFQAIFEENSDTVDFYAFFIPHSYPTQQQYHEGVPVSISQALRNNPNAKIQQTTLREELNRMMQEKNVYEIIMIHPDGYVTEGSRSNLFMIREGEIHTSGDKDVLPGITRKYVLKACELLGIPINFRRVPVEELLSMDALFLTGTSPKVLPIKSVNENIFQVKHQILKSVMKKFDELVQINLESGINFLKY